MTDWYHFGSLCFSAGGIFVFLVIISITQNLKLALPFALDFWMGAGFLKLAANPNWNVIIAVASIVATRKLIGMRAIDGRYV
jgi:hypothetical protein